MAWFKKSEDGDSDMMNSNSRRPSDCARTHERRPEPREPRVEPRTPTARPPEARSHEPRAPESRAAEPRPAEARSPASDAAPRASVLGPTLRFRGELSAQEDLIIQGSVEGSITHTQSLTVGTDGTMKGDIRARVIVVDGKVEGDLYATESVTIRATAKVKGTCSRRASASPRGHSSRARSRCSRPAPPCRSTARACGKPRMARRPSA